MAAHEEIVWGVHGGKTGDADSLFALPEPTYLTGVLWRHLPSNMQGGTNVLSDPC